MGVALQFDEISVCTGMQCVHRSNILYYLAILGILGYDLGSYFATFGRANVTQHQ